jgi:hypothetical protein
MLRWKRMNDFKDTEHSLYLELAKVKKLEARVEELEKRIECNVVIMSETEPVSCPDWHVITDEQIDAAVEWAEACRVRTPNSTPWTALNKLGIKRCKCNGALVPCERCTPTHYEECPDCAKFTGHGWMIGGEDE